MRHHQRHGATVNYRETAEYRCWQGIKDRCLNRKQKGFERYGAKGITVCARWLHSFKRFLKDMGLKPSPKHSIDRVDGNGPYCRTNCRWSTPVEQARNRTKPGTVWRCRCRVKKPPIPESYFAIPGRRIGRPMKTSNVPVQQVCELARAGRSVNSLSNEFGIARSTIRKYLKVFINN